MAASRCPDKAIKMRIGARGEAHNRAKLTDHDVRLMRDLRERFGLPYSRIAEKFEVSHSAAWKAINYWAWSHVR